MNLRQRQPREQDQAYLQWIRGLICLTCQDNTSVEAAHLRRADLRADKQWTGMQTKPNDRPWVLPLCSKCHRLQHEIGEDRFYDHAMVDPTFMCLAISNVYPDSERAERIVRAAQ